LYRSHDHHSKILCFALILAHLYLRNGTSYKKCVGILVKPVHKGHSRESGMPFMSSYPLYTG